MNFTQPSASRGVTMSWVNYMLEIENPDDRLANTRPSFARTMGVGTRSSTPRRLRKGLRTLHGGTERTATLVLTNQENRTFHVISERLTKLLFLPPLGG